MVITLKFTFIYTGYKSFILSFVTWDGRTNVSGTLFTGTDGPAHIPFEKINGGKWW